MGRVIAAHAFDVRAAAGGFARAACCSPGRSPFRWRSAAAASWRTSAKATAATPRGRFRLVRLWWRADRASPARDRCCPPRRIGPQDAWCEDPADRHYNRHIVIPAGDPGDRLRRDDHLYDFIIEISHNMRPRVAGRGSAVFIHMARPGFAPTAGCVAMTRARLRHLLERVGPKTDIVIH